MAEATSLREVLSVLYQRIEKQEGFYYRNVADLIAQCGQDFTPAPLPPGVYRGEPRECFMNAFLLANGDPRFTYCEGYGLRSNLELPIEHAWVVTAEGQAIDPTWDYAEDTQYRGVCFPPVAILTIVLRRGVYGALEDWHAHWPALRQKFDPQALADFYSEGHGG